MKSPHNPETNTRTNTGTNTRTNTKADQGNASSSSKAGSRWAADRAVVGNDKIEGLFNQRKSNVWVVGTGRVVKLLYIDTESPRHQKFLVELSADLTIRIAHNIDIGTQAPLKEGDQIEFKGEYEYTEQGGTVHWTHHDPDGKPGGYISIGGKKFD